MQTERQVISIMGGYKAIGVKAIGGVDFDQLIRKGFNISAGNHMKDLLHLTDNEFAEVLGISTRSLSRMRRAGGRLSPVSSDRLFRVARIFALAKDVLEGESEAIEWLRRPQAGLGGRPPLDLLGTDAGAREVEDLLGRIEHGVLS